MLLKEFLAISILFSISLSDLASCDIMLPRYTKLLTCFILVLSMILRDKCLCKLKIIINFVTAEN